MIERCDSTHFTLPCTERAGHSGNHRNGDIVWWYLGEKRPDEKNLVTDAI